MDFNVKSRTTGAVIIDSPEKSYLAIDSGLKNRSFVGVDTSKLQSLPGLIVADGEISNWKLDGVTEIDGKTVFYGPVLEGRTLASAELTPYVLLKITKALHTIKDRNFPVRQFSLSSVYLCDDDSVLFFPPRLMEFLNNHRTRKDSMEMIEPWNSPGLGGDAGRSFTIAALAYKILTGHIPFPGEDEEEIEKLISKKSYSSPLLAEPKLDDHFVKLMDDSFAGKGTLGLWRDMLGKWISKGIEKENLAEDEIQSIREFEEKRESRRLKGLSAGSFFNRNSAKLIAGAVVLAILGLIIQAPLSKYLAPPATEGMSQKEVVELYYSCFTTLDTEVLEDTITSKAGKGDINEISTIYVTTRVRTSYEGTTGMVQPEQWIAEGMNPVPPGVQIWGISDLKIRAAGTDMFEATYIKWTPAIVQDIDSTEPRLPVGSLVRDRLHLSVKKDAWIIDQLQREKSDYQY